MWSDDSETECDRKSIKHIEQMTTGQNAIKQTYRQSMATEDHVCRKMC